jgi:hypothetical protein
MTDQLTASTDFYWNHPRTDLKYWKEFNQLSVCKRYRKCASDIGVGIFVVIMGIFSQLKLCKLYKPPADEFYSAYTDYVNSRSNLNLKNRNIIVILNSENDKNRSFVCDPQKFQKIEKQSGYDVVFISASKASDFFLGISKLHRNNNHIKALWVRAHGCPYRIILGKEETFSSKPSTAQLVAEVDKSFNRFNPWLMKEICSKLDPDAPIILDSCLTAAQFPKHKKTKNILDHLTAPGLRKNDKTIAQHFAKAAEGRKVYAASKLAYGSTVDFSSEERTWNVALQGIKELNSFNSYSILDRIRVIWHALRSHKEDVTIAITTLDLNV